MARARGLRAEPPAHQSSRSGRSHSDRLAEGERSSPMEPTISTRRSRRRSSRFSIRSWHAIAAHEWPAQEPFMETLAIDVSIPGIERALSYGDEVMSTREALHEDFYFSLLEFFKRTVGPPARGSQRAAGPDRARISARRRRCRMCASRCALSAWPTDPAADASRISRRPMPRPVSRRSTGSSPRFPAKPSRAAPARAAPCAGSTAPGPRPAVLVTGGQHANETSAPVGTLRAVRRLLAQAGGATSPIFPSRTRTAMPCTAPLRRAIRAICIMPRATPPSATISNTAATNLSYEIGARNAGAGDVGRAAASSTCTATRRMNGRGPSRATCRAASSSGRSRRASS